MSEVERVRYLVASMACCLVDKPEAVKVDAFEQEGGILYRLTVAPGDVGKIIGKQGRTAHSIRVILSAVGMKFRLRQTLDIVE